MFKLLLLTSVSKVVATIRGQVNIPAKIGTVICSWNNELDMVHTHSFKIPYYFPESLINILGITAFGKQLNEKETTGIDTKWKKNTFHFKGGYEHLIYHPASQLPAMLLVPNGMNNTFCLYIEHYEAATSCYSASEDVTFATVLNTPTDIDIEASPFKFGERLFYTHKGHISVIHL